MKHRLLLLFLVISSASSVKAQSDSIFTVNCGENIVICPGDVYAFIYSEATDTLFIGKNVSIKGGVPPLTYSWSCKPQGEGKWRHTTNDILNDTSILNPYFLYLPQDYICDFTLKVTDAEGNVAVGSVSLLQEKFIYFTESGSDFSGKSDGNRIYLTGEQEDMRCVFPPMSYFAVIDSDTTALPAYITIQETDSVTIFGIDSIGCYDFPRKELGKWLLVSNTESIAEEKAVKLLGNALFFNDYSEKQIRIYSVNGQLLYSKNTFGIRFDIPKLQNVSNCICNVIVNNKPYSFHLIKP